MKINNISEINGKQVALVKLVLIECQTETGILSKPYLIFHPKVSKPIFISETESPFPNDWVYSEITKTVVSFTDPRFFSEGTYFKVLALPEQLSPSTLKDISEGRLKEGEAYGLEIESDLDTKDREEPIGNDWIPKLSPFVNVIKRDQENINYFNAGETINAKDLVLHPTEKVKWLLRTLYAELIEGNEDYDIDKFIEENL